MWYLCSKDGVSLMNDGAEVSFEPHPVVLNLTAMAAKAGTMISDITKPRPVNKVAAVQKIWQMKGVLLERGHGPNPNGFEPGAVAHGRDEYELNGIACEAARLALVKAGIPVEITDSGGSLHAIGTLAKDFDVFVSVHHNAFNGSAQGVECLYHNVTGDPADKDLATVISSQLSSKLGLINRGAKPQALGVLSGAETTNTRASVLAECYFMDAAVYGKQSDLSRKAGEAIAAGIISWLKDTAAPVKTANATMAYTDSDHVGAWTGLKKFSMMVGTELFYVASGARGAQGLRKPTDPRSVPGNLEPIPQGTYTIGNIEFAGGKDNYEGSYGNGLGPVWVAISADFSDDRGAFGFHLDSNISDSPGSAGCVVFSSVQELKRFVAALRKFDPKKLVVAYGL